DLVATHELFALRHPEEYPFNEGRLASTGGIDVGIEDYERMLGEQHVAHSTALHSRRVDVADAGTICLGPAARFALNRERL
ncbi:hypothetical protein ABTM87_20085, partial [Acinetobacter baumannii]